MTDPKSILVTGCAGFIGSNFVKQFKQKYPNANIVGIDDFSTGRKSVVDTSIDFYEGSILDKKLLEKIFSKHKPEYVFHFAALPRVSFSVEQPVLTTEANITGTVTLLEAAKNHQVKRFIYSSSSSIYGGAEILPTSETDNPPNPKSPYAVQKYAGEPFCKVFSELYDLDTVCLRYFNVYGPGQYGDSPYSTVISAWLEALYFPEGKNPFIEGAGDQTRDFCYIDNVILANMLAMESGSSLAGEAMNIAHGERISVNDLRVLIEDYSGKKLDLEKRPERTGDVKHTYADISKAEKLLGYKPLVKFNDGLRRTVEWFESRQE